MESIKKIIFTHRVEAKEEEVNQTMSFAFTKHSLRFSQIIIPSTKESLKFYEFTKFDSVQCFTYPKGQFEEVFDKIAKETQELSQDVQVLAYEGSKDTMEIIYEGGLKKKITRKGMIVLPPSMREHLRQVMPEQSFDQLEGFEQGREAHSS